VRLTLPAGDPTAQPVVPVAPSVPPAGVEVAAPRGTVLYIEDNAVNTLLVEHLLADWPEVRFAGAPDGESGLRLAAALRPNLVLLDLQLPDIDGMELLERLRAHEATRDVPLVVLSANAMPQDLARARERGATDYWTKPLDFQKFLAGTAALLPAAAPAPAPESTPAPLSG
jgi:CheY-like chemotaxis protein